VHSQVCTVTGQLPNWQTKAGRLGGQTQRWESWLEGITRDKGEDGDSMGLMVDYFIQGQGILGWGLGDLGGTDGRLIWSAKEPEGGKWPWGR